MTRGIWSVSHVQDAEKTLKDKNITRLGLVCFVLIVVVIKLALSAMVVRMLSVLQSVFYDTKHIVGMQNVSSVRYAKLG